MRPARFCSWRAEQTRHVIKGRRLFLLAVGAIRQQAAELVATGKSLRCQPSGVGAIAAPIGELLERKRKGAASGICPREPLVRLEGLDIAQTAIFVALQPHAAPTPHFRHLIDRKDDYLAVFADAGD